MQTATDAQLLSEKIENSVKTREPVEGNLKTNDRIIARVTDGIYREPWSAFRELISNAYDADATKVTIDCDYPFFKEIRISDNGNGMDENIIGDLLENIGGSSKRTARGKILGTANVNDPTRSPGGRKLIGKIGIGLFAVAQLTQQFQIISKRKGENKRVSASIKLHTYKEDSLIDEEGEKNYSSGTYSVIAEESPDTDHHGTTIILTGIRPAIREKLQSQEVWSAVDDNDLQDGSGLIDAVVPPHFNIGRLDEDGNLIKSPSLPWKHLDSPPKKFAKLFDAAIDYARTSRDQANLAHFDNYLKMIWRISLASPVAYIDQHPFDITENDGFDIYQLSNKKKGIAEQVHCGKRSIREVFGLSAGMSAPNGNFTVIIDSVELRRPIRLPKEIQGYSRFQRPAMFVGKAATNFGGANSDRSGGNLAFEAYLYWNTRIVPKENIGVIIRVNNASGTLFDAEYLGYQVAEQTRKKQITCEIFVTEGLDGAINIDRESFNTSHPHYLYIQKWLHSAFRQFANQNKKLGRLAREAEFAQFQTSRDEDFRRLYTDIWTKMRGDALPPPRIIRQSGPIPSLEDFTVGDIPIAVERTASIEAIHYRSELIDAVSVVLDAYGVLENLNDERRAQLIFDLVSVLEALK